MTQYHNIDESGDPGLNRSAGSSSHLVLAMVQLADHAPLAEIASVRQAFHLPFTFEFKYHKTTPDQKRLFFESVQVIPFRVRCVVISKAALGKRFADMSGQDLVIEFIAGMVMRASELDIANDILIMDGATLTFLRTLRARLSSECRQFKRVRPFKKIISGDSSRDDGLQLADMVAGAIRQHATGVESGHYRTFAGKIVDCWEVSGNEE